MIPVTIKLGLLQIPFNITTVIWKEEQKMGKETILNLVDDYQ